MKKGFRHIDKTEQVWGEDDEFLDLDMEETVPENEEAVEGGEYCFEEEYSDEEYMEPEYVEAGESGQAEACGGDEETGEGGVYGEFEGGGEYDAEAYFIEENFEEYMEESPAEEESAGGDHIEPEYEEPECMESEYEEPEYMESEYEEPECMESEYEEPECMESEYEEPEYMESEYEEPECMESEYEEPDCMESEYAESEHEEPDYMEAGQAFWVEEKDRASAGRGGTGARRKQPGGLDVIDKVMLGAGAAVLVLAVAAAGVFFRERFEESQTTDFAGVGVQLQGITVIGERGLEAVAYAETARMEAAVLREPDEVKTGYDETVYDRQISVSPIFTSIHKDLKIKFVNQKTGKLVPNVPFSVVVTEPGGKSFVWSDEDMDGIIYKKDIAAGQYQVAMEAPADPRYSAYTVSSAVRPAVVQEKIVYEQVDVANEVKTESEVNVAQEDTRQNEVEVESVLTDTVVWVESKVIAAAYIEVSRSTIPDPLTIALNRALMAVSEDAGVFDGAVKTEAGTDAPEAAPALIKGNISVSTGAVSMVAGESVSVTVQASDFTPGEGVVYSAVSSNTGVAAADIDSAGGLTVTGVAAGTASISVTANYEGGQEETAAAAVIDVTVRIHPSEDAETKLKDVSGNQLYVLENSIYREASYADYYKAEAFFLKGETRYSGWQTIDGKIYYFTADGERVTGEQVIQGAKYQFADDGSLVTGEGAAGIDVSKWNGAIDWTAVKNSGMSYAIIRCGYRGSSAGKLIEDSRFKDNIMGALTAGLKVGIYFYSQAVDEIEAVEEASMVLEQIKNYRISYPVFIDVEKSGGRGDKIDSGTRTAVCKAFCQTVQNAGYTAGIYSNKLWMEQKINMAELNAYKVWLAQYAASPTYAGKYDIWQYKANGSVSGVGGSVDLNVSYLGD